MTTAEFDRLWPDLLALRPRKVVLTGGEPLLRPDAVALLRGLRAANTEHRVTTALNTNGFPITRDVAHGLVGLVEQVRVSLDGDRGPNDAMRGPGSFDAAMRALACLRDAGFEPRVMITVTPTVLPGLADLLCRLVERGITDIKINPFRPIGRGTRHPEWTVSGGDIVAAIRQAWQRSHPDRPYVAPRSAGPEQTHCGVGRFLNIMPNGDVFPCHVLTQPELRLGNVRRDRLAHICRRGGILAGLAGLNFAAMSAEEPAVAGLTRPHTCMATVYQDTRSQPVWRRALPLLPTPPVRRPSSTSSAARRSTGTA
jgi:MoaA/NifB/PqqE/SkfB family radical SAM enzyme